MSLLSRLEGALARVAEGGAERVFGGRLDLVAVGQELYNAAVEGSRRGPDGAVAPNAYDVRLALDDFGHFSHEVEALQARYAAALWARLREADYALDTPPGVLITPDETVGVGTSRVRAAFAARVPAFTLTSPDGGAIVHRLTPPAVVGRASDCDLALAGASVSRRHARIVWERNRFAVEDLGSSNGLWVNGVGVSRASLEAGDRLGLGQVVLQFAPEIAPLPVGSGATSS